MSKPYNYKNVESDLRIRPELITLSIAGEVILVVETHVNLVPTIPANAQDVQGVLNKIGESAHIFLDYPKEI
jgi:hypothetical protein